MNINANIIIENERHLDPMYQTADIRVQSHKVSDVIVLTQAENTIELSIGQIYELRKAFEQIMD